MSPDLIGTARAELARTPRAVAVAVAPTRLAAASPAGLAPGDRVGDWTIGRCLGVGGMGVVHAAVHAIIGKQVAIKIVRAELRADPRVAERFIQEARLVNQIAHPTVVDIFEIGWLPDRRPYLVMELLCGGTLAERLAVTPPRRDEAVPILLALCDALTVAHARGIIHRDLKPQNVFLAETSAGTVVKLIDWGVARQASVEPSGGGVTRNGGFVGTPQYAAPEQARGRAIDGRADVYSLGAVAYELLLGRAPFIADNPADLINMHLREPPPLPRSLWHEVPSAFADLLVAMLAKDPAGRPGIREVRAVLQTLRRELGSAAWAGACGTQAPADGAGSAIDGIATWDMPARSASPGPSPGLVGMLAAALRRAFQ